MFSFKHLKKIFSFSNSTKNISPESGLTLVGVGPGDPSLLTIAAVKAIKDASLVAYPIARIGAKGIAKEIASQFIEGKKCMPLLFPMISEMNELNDAWEVASDQLVKAVKDGEKVVLLCQGDPSLYATSSYILLKIKLNYPMLCLKVIPGISSFNAAAAAAQMPLSLQKECLLVSCVPDNREDFEMILDDFNSTRKVLVLLKLGKRWEWVRNILEDRNLLEDTLFAQGVGMPSQRIEKAIDIDEGEASYFSLLIIRRKSLFIS